MDDYGNYEDPFEVTRWAREVIPKMAKRSDLYILGRQGFPVALRLTPRFPSEDLGKHDMGLS
jgi:hypothetical protein